MSDQKDNKKKKSKNMDNFSLQIIKKYYKIL